MRTVGIIAIVGLVGLLLVGGCGGMYCLSTVSREVDLRTQIQAKQEANKPSFDTMWKILAQKAGVTEQYKKDFKEIWPELIAGRYSQGGGKMMLWIQERNPDFDSSLYKDLMASIEAERKRFLRDQQLLIDYKREHDQLRKRPISGLVLRMFGDASEATITIVTSAQTDTAFATGQENDTDLFKKTDAAPRPAPKAEKEHAAKK
jgi:L-rhamnose mutarotase